MYMVCGPKHFFSVLQIKLYTKQGSLKYQTDCAPINGYFMIPLYDKVMFLKSLSSKIVKCLGEPGIPRTL